MAITVQDVRDFVDYWRARGYTFGYNDYTAADVTAPILLGDGIVAFPPDWTEAQKREWRVREKLVAPDHFARLAQMPFLRDIRKGDYH